jgi:DNA mismatch repair protein MSH4
MEVRAIQYFSDSSSRLNATLHITQLPQICKSLSGATNVLLTTIRQNVSAGVLSTLHSAIAEVITEDTTWARTPLAMRQHECFAVKPGIDGNLDAVRTVS